jgi:predicted kinase
MASGNEPGPALIILSGLPGSGKTTFARQLRPLLAFDHYESDAIRREIFPRPRYTFAESRIVFTEIERRVARSLAAGRITLADATNLLEEHRTRFAAIAGRFAAPSLVVRLTAPDETVRKRLSRGREGHSTAGIDVYERMRPERQASSMPSVVVDTRFPLEPALRLVLALLGQSV